MTGHEVPSSEYLSSLLHAYQYAEKIHSQYVSDVVQAEIRRDEAKAAKDEAFARLEEARERFKNPPARNPSSGSRGGGSGSSSNVGAGSHNSVVKTKFGSSGGHHHHHHQNSNNSNMSNNNNNNSGNTSRSFGGNNSFNNDHYQPLSPKSGGKNTFNNSFGSLNSHASNNSRNNPNSAVSKARSAFTPKTDYSKPSYNSSNKNNNSSSNDNKPDFSKQGFLAKPSAYKHNFSNRGGIGNRNNNNKNYNSNSSNNDDANDDNDNQKDDNNDNSNDNKESAPEDTAAPPPPPPVDETPLIRNTEPKSLPAVLSPLREQTKRQPEAIIKRQQKNDSTHSKGSSKPSMNSLAKLPDLENLDSDSQNVFEICKGRSREWMDQHLDCDALGLVKRFCQASFGTKTNEKTKKLRVFTIVLNDEWNDLAVTTGDIQEMYIGKNQNPNSKPTLRDRACEALVSPPQKEAIALFFAPRASMSTSDLYYVGHWKVVDGKMLVPPRTVKGQLRQTLVKFEFVGVVREIVDAINNDDAPIVNPPKEPSS